ncbi:MAG: HlyD family secretion protein [Desulfobacteraceae bacterium Eth-SRB2]|nr:MAG: HlyD family secretion protein [Desulfobacteraceae bacterium Eth-SRB2]
MDFEIFRQNHNPTKSTPVGWTINTMKRFFKIFILAVIFISGGVLGGRWFIKMKNNPSTTELKIYGNIDIRDANLAFNEQERIAEIFVEEGDRVKKGQVLAILQTHRLEAQIQEAEAQIAAQQEVVKRLEAGTRPQEIEQARAEVLAAKAIVRNSMLNFERISKTSGATSQQALDNARAQFDVDQAQLKVKEKALNLALEGPRKEDIAAAKNTLEALKAFLSLLKIRLADMTLISPSPGIIRNRILEPGEMASPNQPVVTLMLTDPKWVRSYVSEPDLGRINLGMKAKILSDSFPDQSFEGWIGFISPVAEFTPKTVETEDLRTKLVYEVRVFVHDSKDLLRLGMPVTVIVDRTALPVYPGTAKSRHKKPSNLLKDSKRYGCSVTYAEHGLNRCGAGGPESGKDVFLQKRACDSGPAGRFAQCTARTGNRTCGSGRGRENHLDPYRSRLDRPHGRHCYRFGLR